MYLYAAHTTSAMEYHLIFRYDGDKKYTFPTIYLTNAYLAGKQYKISQTVRIPNDLKGVSNSMQFYFYSKIC